MIPETFVVAKLVPSAVPLLVGAAGEWDTSNDPVITADTTTGTLQISATIDHFTNYMSAKGPLWVLVTPVESPQEMGVVWPVTATVWNKRTTFSLQINESRYGAQPPPIIEEPPGARHTDFILEGGARQRLDAPVPQFTCVRREESGTYEIEVDAERRRLPVTVEETGQRRVREADHVHVRRHRRRGVRRCELARSNRDRDPGAPGRGRADLGRTRRRRAGRGAGGGRQRL